MQPQQQTPRSRMTVSNIILGPLRSDFILLPNGRFYQKISGGSAAYAASGASLFFPGELGLVSRIGEDYPGAWLEDFATHGWDCSGIRRMKTRPPTICFYSFDSNYSPLDTDPVQALAMVGLPCPADLVDYISPTAGEEQTLQIPDHAIRPEDIPGTFHSARAAYIAPCHLSSQITLSVELRHQGIGLLMLSPSERIMTPAHLTDFPVLLQGVDVMFARDVHAVNVFRERFHDIHLVAEAFSQFGARTVILQCGYEQIHIYNSESKRHSNLPMYPSEKKNPLGIGDSFCGGFLSAWRTNYDPVESALYGCISASMSMEGMGSLFAVNRNPALARTRLRSLRDRVIKK